MLPVQPVRRGGAYKKLRPVRVGAGIGHGEAPEPGVLARFPGKALIGEFRAIDGLSPGAIPRGEVPALAHKSRDDAVEGTVFEMQRFA